MKKIVLSFLLIILPILASAEKVEIDGIWYNLVTKIKEAEVTYGNWNINGYNPYDNGYFGKIDIPENIIFNEVSYHVTSIGDYAFAMREGVTSITIPNSIVSIGDNAFSDCRGLTTMIIPNSVKAIGFGAFNTCTGLTSVTIPNSITSIERATFSWCTSLTSLNIPQSVTVIDISAFYHCIGLTSVTIPNSVTSIANYAFYECVGLTSVTIPNSVTSIGGSAFSGCSSLTSVTIPNSVTSIGYEAFSGCSGLNSVAIGSNMNIIDNLAFSKCINLSDVFCSVDKISDGSMYSEGLFTAGDAFKDSYPQAITLHVPAASIEAYRSIEPWSQFKMFVAIEGGDTPITQKCATPEISYANGKVSLSCETQGVDFISEVIVEDAKKYYDSEFTLSQTYKISVYATKAGYENSDVATREIVIENGQTSLFGDINKDGKVNVTDVVKLIDIIMNE